MHASPCTCTIILLGTLLPNSRDQHEKKMATEF